MVVRAEPGTLHNSNPLHQAPHATAARDEALQVFGRRFDGAGLSDEEIAEHFDFLNAAAFSISAMGLMERFRCVCVGGDPANDLHRGHRGYGAA